MRCLRFSLCSKGRLLSRRNLVLMALDCYRQRSAAAIGAPLCLALGLQALPGRVLADDADTGSPQLLWAPELSKALRERGAVGPPTAGGSADDPGVFLRPSPALTLPGEPRSRPELRSRSRPQIPAEVPAQLPAQLPVDVPAQLPVDVPAQPPAQAQVPAPAPVPAEASAPAAARTRREGAADEADDALSEAGRISSRALVGPSASDASGAEEQQPVKPAPGWHMVPIAWSGTLGTDLGVSGGDIGSTITSHSERLNLNANSFIWQPWFARVSGSMALQQSTVSADNRDADATSVSVGGRLSLFPVSRFPIDGYFDTTTTEFNSGGNSNSGRFESQLFGLSGVYRPPDDSYNASGNIQHSRFDSGHGNESSLTIVNASYSPRIMTEMPQTLTTDGSYSTGTNKFASSGFGVGSASSLDTNSLNLRAVHTIDLNDYYGLTVSSDANLNHDKREFVDSEDSSVTLAQANSTFNWQPVEDLPLRLTGSIRAQQFETQYSGQDMTIRSVSGQVSTNYNLDNQWSVFGGLQSTYVSNIDTTSTSFGGNTGVSFQGLPLSFGGFDYAHGAQASATFNTMSEGGSQESLSASFFHSLLRQIPLGSYGPLLLNLNQSYGTMLRNGSDGSVHTVSTAASLSWSMVGAQQQSLSASVGVSDSRSFGDDSSVFQSITASANGTLPLSAYSSAGLTANVNFSRREDSGQSNDSFVSSSASDWIGAAVVQTNYRNSRLFSVPRLEYSGSYTFTARSSSAGSYRVLLPGGGVRGTSSNAFDDGSGFQFDHTILQFLDYRLGRLTFRLTNNLTMADDGTKQGSIFLSVNREMGGVLDF